MSTSSTTTSTTTTTTTIRIPLGIKPAAPLFMLGAIGYLGENLSPYFITAISAGAGVDTVAASSVTTVMFIATAIVGIITTPLAASSRRRALASASLLVAALGLIMAAFATTLPLMFVAVAVAGIGSGGVMSTGGATIAAFRDPDRVAGWSGLVNAGVTAAALAVIPLFGLLPMSVFAPLALVCLASVLLIRWLPTPEHAAVTMSADALLPGVAEVRAERRPVGAGIWLLILFPVWGITETAVWAMSSEAVRAHAPMAEEMAGFVFSAGEIAALLGAGALTLIGGRLGRAAPLTVLLLSSAVLKGAMGLATDPALFSVLFIVWDMVSAVAFLYFIAVAAGLDANGTWSAPMSAVYMIGTAFAPVLGAASAQALGFPTFFMILGAVGTVIVLPVIFLARLSSRRQAEHEAEEQAALQAQAAESVAAPSATTEEPLRRTDG